MRIGPLNWLTAIPLKSMAIVLGFVTLALLGLSAVLKDDRLRSRLQPSLSIG